MEWQVRWIRTAWADVEAAARFIARDSPRYAIILQREAQSAAESLRRFPRRGRVVAERADERLRELVVAKTYRLIYRIVSDAEIHVVAFIHGARDLDAFLATRNRL